MCSKRNLLFKQLYKNRRFIPPLKMSCFIELSIRGDPCFWDQCQHLTVMKNRRHIIQLPILFQRQSHKSNAVLPSGKSGNFLQLFFACHKQCFLQEQVMTGITGNTKLRKNKEHCSFLLSLLYLLTDHLTVINRVCYLKIRCNGCRLDKSMLHMTTLILLPSAFL